MTMVDREVAGVQRHRMYKCVPGDPIQAMEIYCLSKEM